MPVPKLNDSDELYLAKDAWRPVDLVTFNDRYLFEISQRRSTGCKNREEGQPPQPRPASIKMQMEDISLNKEVKTAAVRSYPKRTRGQHWSN